MKIDKKGIKKAIEFLGLEKEDLFTIEQLNKIAKMANVSRFEVMYYLRTR